MGRRRKEETETEIKVDVSLLADKAQKQLSNMKQKIENITISTDARQYHDDLQWYENNILSGLMTWVDTIDPLLFLQYMSIHSLSYSKVKDPVVQTFVIKETYAQSFEKAMATSKDGNFIISNFKESSTGTTQKVITNYRLFISEINKSFENPGGPKSSPFAVFCLRVLNEEVMNFVADMQEIYTKYWGTTKQDANASIPLGFPKVVFLPVSPLKFATYMNRKVLYVNFDAWSSKSKYSNDMRRLSLINTENEQRVSKVSFPLTLLEQTAATNNLTNDISLLVKKSLIESSPGLQSVEDPPDINSIAGYEVIKDWIEEMKDFMKSKYYKESERPRGLILIGPPGTGKSTFAKIVAGAFGWPLIKMDIDQMKAGVQGETEHNVSQALQTLTTMRNGILWLDEIEKSLGGIQSSNATDGGVLMGIFSKILQFMESDDHNIIIVGTSNSYKELPPAFIRAGRIDIVAYAGIPNVKTRKNIIDIHLKRTQLNDIIIQGSHIYNTLTKFTENYTGAEVEALLNKVKRLTVKENIFNKVQDSATEVTMIKIIDKSRSQVKPIFMTRKEEIEDMKNWAESNAILTEYQ